jgi:cell division protein FtsA
MTRGLGERMITSIDVGTTKISVLIAHHLEGSHVDLIGIGTVPSHGLQKGVVVDVPRAIRSITLAIKEAELMAGMSIETAYVGISGAHIHAINSHGVVPIKRGVVTEADVSAVLAAAQAIVIPEGQQIIHVLPQFFMLDGRDRVLDPVGMHGIRLEVTAHIVLGAVASVQNLVTCCEKAGVHVRDIILEQLASAEAILSADERELGVGLLDIGGGTADFAVYQRGSIRHTKVIPVAGNHFTNDVAIGLRTTLQDAERIKRMYGGVAALQPLESTEEIELTMVQGEGKQRVTHAALVRIIEPRAYELLRIVQHEIMLYALRPYMATGLVLTGGGALLGGLDTLTQHVLGMPVRIGSPHTMFDMPETLRTPMYATGYGILIHVLKKQEEARMHNAESPLLTRIVDRMQRWMKELF